MAGQIALSPDDQTAAYLLVDVQLQASMPGNSRSEEWTWGSGTRGPLTTRDSYGLTRCLR